MNNIHSIRKRLGMTQIDFSQAIDVSRGNVSHYERGMQEVPPKIARRVIEAAKLRGHALTFDDIYAPSSSSTTTQKARK